MAEPTWQSQCRQMLREVDPGNQFPVYLLSEAEAGQDIGPWAALTGPILSSKLSNRIPGFKGEGFTAVFAPQKAMNWSEIEGWCLHEYAHFANNAEQVSGIELIERLAPEAVEEFRADLHRESKRIDVGEISRPWEGHSHGFIRNCIHLTWRANQHGWGIESGHVFDGNSYLLSSLNDYSQALGDEPQRLRDVPMKDIAETELPDRFHAFADADVERAERYLSEAAERRQGEAEEA